MAIFDPAHTVAVQIRRMIEQAPAGGMFHDVKLTEPKAEQWERSPARFYVRLRDGRDYEVTVTPLQ